ncbi:YgaP family membrane protein [Rhodohalobacter sp. 8-1]|uniref:YgaP family membrane protein n=1 Tax=Rhodohalobacter sp. 8-1 TaxID=3131972 RepID=UPI0030ED351B
MRIVKKNVGNVDSVLRVALGMIIILAGLYYNNLWGLAGIILVGSGALAFCPIYRIFGIQTCSANLEREN